MNEQNEAVVVLCKCGEAHKTYGIRAEKKAPNSWLFTWAFPIKESSAKREGYCKEQFIVVCNCGHISCHIVKGNQFTCEWCGLKGTVVDYTGESIKAGSDL